MTVHTLFSRDEVYFMRKFVVDCAPPSAACPRVPMINVFENLERKGQADAGGLIRIGVLQKACPA